MSQDKVDVNKLLTQAELIDRLVERFSSSTREDVKGLSKVAIREVFNTVTEVIADAVVEGHRVTLKNVGIITTRLRPARTFRNPFNQEEMKSEDTVIVRYSVPSSLKERVVANKKLLTAHKKLEKEKAKAKKLKK